MIKSYCHSEHRISSQVLNFKSNLGAYGHNLLPCERDARGANLHPGVNLHPGANLHQVQIAHMNTALEARGRIKK